MTRAVVLLNSPANREKAARWAMKGPAGSRVEFRGPKRTLDQNSLMWALLTEIAEQVEHCGRKYPPSIWKSLLMQGCGREMEFIPSLDGTTFMPLGHSSSNLSKGEMVELIEFILSWGAQNGVKFSHDT